MFASSSTTTLIKITSFLISLVVSLIVPTSDNILSLPFLPLLDSGARFKVTTPGWSLEFELGQPSSRYLPKASSRIPSPLVTPKAIAPTDIIVASVRADSRAGGGSDPEEADRPQNLESVLAALQARQSATITSNDTTPSTPPSTPRQPPTTQSSRRSWIPTSDAMQGLAAVLVGARQFGGNSGTVRTSTSIHPVQRQPPIVASPPGSSSTVFAAIQNSHFSSSSSTTSILTTSPVVASRQPLAQTITPRRRAANPHQLAAILITSHQERHSRSSGGRRSSFPTPPPLPLPMPKTPVQWCKEKAEKDGDPDDEDPEDGGAESNSEPKHGGLWSLAFCLVVVAILFWYPGRWMFKLFLRSVRHVITAFSRVSRPKVISSSRSMSMNNIHSSGPVQATQILSSQASPSSTRIFSTQTTSMSMHDVPSEANIRSDPIVHPPPHTKSLSIYQVPSAPIVLTNPQTPRIPRVPVISQIPRIIQPPTVVSSQLPCLTLLASIIPIFIPALRVHHLIAVLIGVLVVVFWWAHVGNCAIGGLVRYARKKDERAVVPDQQLEAKAREVALACVVEEGCKPNMKEGGAGSEECDGDIPTVGLESEVEGVSDGVDLSLNENISTLSSLDADAISSMMSAEEPASVDAPTSSEDEVTLKVQIPPSSSATSVAPASLRAVAAQTALPPDSPAVANTITPTPVEIIPTSPPSASIATPTMLFVTTPVSIEAVATPATPSPSASTPPSSAKLRVSAPIFTPTHNAQEKENVPPDQSNQDKGKELAVPSTVHDDVFVARPTVSHLVVQSNSEPYSPLPPPQNIRPHAIPIVQPLSKSRKIKLRKKRSKETKARILEMLAAEGMSEDDDEHEGEEDAVAESPIPPVTVSVSVASASVDLPPRPPPPTYERLTLVTQQNQPVNQDRGLSSSRHAAFDQDRDLHGSRHAVFNHDLSFNSSRHAAINQDRGLSSSRHAAINHDRGLSSSRHAAINHDRGLSSSRHAAINCDRGLNSSRHAVQPHDFQHRHYGGGGSNTYYPHGSQPRYAPYSC